MAFSKVNFAFEDNFDSVMALIFNDMLEYDKNSSKNEFCSHKN